ncbi:MAG: hypothetical protein V8S58_08645 [Lachnospiraceae bacterium]
MNKEKVYVKVDSTFDPTGYMQPTSITWSEMDGCPSKQYATSAPPGLPITVTLVTASPYSSRGRKSICSLNTSTLASMDG